MLQITVNDRSYTLDVEPEMPLLWVLRDQLGLPGTKYGCGIALCGACTVLVDGEPLRACVVPVAAVVGKHVVSIEGLAKNGLHRVQKAWIEHQVPQCGYCQSGMILAAVALLEKNPNPSDAVIDATMSNLCRCGTYARARQAIHSLAQASATGKPE